MGERSTDVGESELGSCEMAVSVTTVTLVGFSKRKFPLERGNCFGVLTEKGEEYRIVNFAHENWEEMLKRGIKTPVRILPISTKQAIIHDERIPDAWYTDRWCETCCPYELLPLPQRLAHERARWNGSEVSVGDTITRYDGSKLPDLRTEEEIREAEEARDNFFKNAKVKESTGATFANLKNIQKVKFTD